MSESSLTKTRSKSCSWMLWSASAVAAIVVISIASPSRGQDLKAAASNYADSCVDCHGQSGKGDGPKAAELKTKPANYTDCAKMSKLADDYLFNIIKKGGKALNKSKEMADFGKAYDDDEIRGLVAYVRSFCGK